MKSKKGHIQSKIREYTAIFEPDHASGGFTAYIPMLPGCISEGDTFEETLKNIQEAADLYMETMDEKLDKLSYNEDRPILVPVRVKV